MRIRTRNAITALTRWLGEVDHGFAVMRGDPDGRDAQAWHHTSQAWLKAVASAPTERGWPPPPRS